MEVCCVFQFNCSFFFDVGTICVRFAMFPLVILAQRNAVDLQNNMPTMQRLQERMIAARRSGDHAGGKFVEK